jgi:hypothetical protein
MTRIIIDVSKGELDFVREAVLSKHTSLMSYLDACENEVAAKPTHSDIAKFAEKEFDKELAAIKKPHWTHTAKGKKILAARKRTKK